ncbi:hypothetical protein GCM10010174_54560 [Kutzneria viridogrisea]|uniref:ATPase involved in chromosome partitioning n=2 Tax=Kutzneria TaxID=43356 RepID=W5W228_9PSEU|nr:hypothetical protein [Kutzneria albida]AHH94596.1 ATPase involved in chromosome partitioning [Kutzneria albida DSM 43870]MBA8930264.1 putative peptide zinc metalloprotease protein [Kutzneria viridogrisea]
MGNDPSVSNGVAQHPIGKHSRPPDTVLAGTLPVRWPAPTQPPVQRTPPLWHGHTPPLPPTPAPPPVLPMPPALPPTTADLLASRPQRNALGPAEWGWQGKVRKLTGGRITPRMSEHERVHRESVLSVQRSLDGPKTVVVVNPKGGANKTVATYLLGATFGVFRGGWTLAWDNNETRGTLGWRAQAARHSNTALGLLRDLDRFTDLRSARVGDLDNYVRGQGEAQFDVLASDEDPTSATVLDGAAFQRLHRVLARFYRVIVVDTGNNMRAPNWLAALESADQLVIVSTVREDTGASAAWLCDGLHNAGHTALVRNAVTVLSAPDPKPDPRLSAALRQHFGQLTRAVVPVPYDPLLVPGDRIIYRALSSSTRGAWLRVAAAVANGL